MATKDSGKYWVTWANVHAKNSLKVDDLEANFKPKAEAFIKALEDGGATVNVKATKRNKKRANLFHWSWKISLGKCNASDATALTGVDINWDHGNDTKSKAAAKELVTGFGLATPLKSVFPPSMTSNHIKGKAIDMDITWEGSITVKKKDGTDVPVDFNSDVGLNTTLHSIGESYGVKKLVKDAPHWSSDGK